MKTKPYNKHQLYKGNYTMDDGGEIILPDDCKWIVKRHSGNCVFDEPDGMGEITLLLEENYSPTSGFWSVISFLTEEEAKELVQQLVSAISHTKHLEYKEVLGDDKK